MGAGEYNLFQGNRVPLTIIRMIHLENTKVEGSSLLESQISIEFFKYLCLINDKARLVKLK